MSTSRKYIAACIVGALAGVPVVSLAQGAACQRVEFSQPVVDRFPRIREACQDVITRDGTDYAVIKAQLVRTASNGVTVRIKHPDGKTSTDSRFIRTKPDLRVTVDGKPVRVEDLAVGQEITAYVRVTEPVIALAPAVPTEVLVVTPLDAAPPAVASNEPAMPRTAGPLPAIGVAGLALLLSGGVLGLIRRRRAVQGE